MNWNIQPTKWDNPEYQALYGDDQTIVVTDKTGKEVCWIGVTEVIESCPPRFLFQHAIECVKQGVWKPDADGLRLGGEVACWAQLIQQKANSRRKARA